MDSTVDPTKAERPRVPFKMAICALALAVCIVSSPSSGVFGSEISVQAQVESRDVYMGQSFLFQISVEGADEISPPDLSLLEGFSVEYMGGSNNSSHSISIVNGRVQRIVHKGFIFTYRLTPTKIGRLTIPSIGIDVEGKTFTTRPIIIAVRRPSETEDFKLRTTLSRETCYVGEPVIYTVTWYLRKDVQGFRFTVPLFENKAFHFETPEVQIDRNKKYFRVPVGSEEVIAEKDKGILDGKTYATLTFSKAVIPERAGDFMIFEAIVECEAASGFGTGRDFFDEFFSDDFFGRRRGRKQSYVIPSNTLSLDVRDLPLEGRPDGFTGHVGEYRITTEAEPLEVNVGDPITLRVIVEGPDYLGSVGLPPLADQAELARDFKIPDERADGRVEGAKKIFTQTIRAKNDGVEAIPPIRLVYFDTKQERYMTAVSEPVPIAVRPTKVITAMDAEGMEEIPSSAPLQMWKEGIAYNYEGPEVLAHHDFGLSLVLTRPSWLSALILPPAVYLLILAGLLGARRRAADPAARKAKGAMRRLRAGLRSLAGKKDLSQADFFGGVLDALKDYLGDKLRCTGSSLTSKDVEEMLGSMGVGDDVVLALRNIMSNCETGAYAGTLSSLDDRESFTRNVEKAAMKLERSL